MRGLPLAYPGQRIGLFGGSFDPAHAGHAHVAETALKRLALDRVWWLVSPQNPLKPRSGPLAQRLASAKRQARGIKMVATDLESRIGARYTIDTLRALKRLYPGVRFTFVMGEDNLESFRRWRDWRAILRLAPIAVVSRPGVGPRALRAFPGRPVFLAARLHPQTSTALRAAVAEPARKC